MKRATIRAKGITIKYNVDTRGEQDTDPHGSMSGHESCGTL